jgi:GNAT superfamily N-acetyltransferase
VAESTHSQWRGGFDNSEVNALHAEAFGTRVFSNEEWDWVRQTANHSLGWVTARQGGDLVGFVNVIWDGVTHAWIQDLMVASNAQREGIGAALIAMARDHAREANCEWLHVDFDDDQRDIYYNACGFEPTNAGLIHLPDAPNLDLT